MRVFRGINQTIYSWISKRYMSGCSSYNSLTVRKSYRSKKQARRVFEKNAVPHAKGTVFFNPWVAIKFAKTYGFPLVVKPNVSGYSRGSYFPIENYQQLWKAIILAKMWWPTTVIEQYLLGKNYRVVVVDGQLMSAIQRFAPRVVGDGVSRIETLIDTENSMRKALDLLECMYAITKDKKTTDYLATQGLTLKTILPMGQVADLYFRISLAPGGTVDVGDKATIPEANKALFLKVLTLFEANILGVDVIFSKGIETPHTDQECIFLEVNSRPYLKMHEYPRHTKKEDLTPFYERLDALAIEDANLY